jgi:pimeloyl-ACP methyl ester carboxylesterase
VSSSEPREAVVLVHGLWMPGAELAVLRRRLARSLDAEARTFTYATRRESRAAVEERLRGALAECAADGARRVHVVAHSLGGVILLRLLAAREARGEGPPLPPGRVVLLGAPVQGSRAAAVIGASAVGRWSLGSAYRELGLSDGAPPYDGPREVGVLAGTRPVGLGRFLARFPGPSDGTVGLEETRLEGAHDRIELPVSHFGMVFSRDVAEAAACFLRTGRFRPQTVPRSA